MNQTEALQNVGKKVRVRNVPKFGTLAALTGNGSAIVRFDYGMLAEDRRPVVDTFPVEDLSLYDTSPPTWRDMPYMNMQVPTRNWD